MRQSTAIMLLKSRLRDTSWTDMIGSFLASYIIYVLIRRYIRHRKVKALGGYAPSLPSYVPFGIDIIAKAVYSTMHHQNLRSWQGFFSHGRGWTVESFPLGLRVVFTADPENIKAILATQFADYGKGRPFHDDFAAFLGDSIFTTDAEAWRAARQLIRPLFARDRVGDLAVFEEHAQVLMRACANGGVVGATAAAVADDGVACGREVDVCDLFFRYTLDAATHFLLGQSVGSLEVEQQDFAVAFAEVQRVQNIIARAGPLRHFIPRGSFNRGIKTIDSFVNPFIERALGLSPDELASKTKSESGYTFLHALAGYTRDRKVLRDQLVAVLLAGRDTTAATLSWTFYELARHPECVERLRREILDTIGPTKPPTYEDLKNMKYLQHTINETLRIYPAIPYNVRLALRDTTLPHGGGPDGLSPMGVLKDTPVGYSPLVMQRRPELYPPLAASSSSSSSAAAAAAAASGPVSPRSPSSAAPPSAPFPPSVSADAHGASAAADPLAFDPSRWDAWQPAAWRYVPFNGGPRICVGQQFALAEIGYTVARMLQRFARVEARMRGVDGGEPQLKAEIVLRPGQGVRVAFWEGGRAGAERVEWSGAERSEVRGSESVSE